MYRYITTTLKVILGAFLLLILKISFIFLLPSPFSSINIIFIVLIMLILMKSEQVMWLALCSTFFIELYSTNPFGVIMISAVTSIYLAKVFYKRYFTNKTYYTTATLTLLSLIIFRGLFLVVSFLIKVIKEENFLITRYLQPFSMELITSTISSILLFFILQFFFKSLQTSRIKKDWFKKA